MLAILMLNNMRNRRRRNSKNRTEIPPKIIDVEPVLDYCRTCMGNEDLMSIFYNRDTAKKRTEDLQLVTGLEIKYNDGMSQKICTKCIEIINQLLQFRIMCTKSEVKQRKLLQQNRRLVGDEVLYGTEMYEACDMSAKTSEDSSNTNETFKMDHDYLKTDMAIKDQPPHGLKSPVMYKCHICTKVYSNRSTFRAHVNSHMNFFICEAGVSEQECGRRCSSRTLLVQHQQACHGRRKAYACDLCRYQSATKSALTIHMRRHTGERPYVCEHCGAGFHSRAGLVQHLPIHLAESNFECPICGKREKSRRLLQHHHHKVHARARRRQMQIQMQEGNCEQ